MNINTTGQMERYTQVRLERPESARVNGRSAQAGKTVPQTDTVSVSDEAILRTETYRTAMATSDIRWDKVNAIKEQIANGSYQVDSLRTAEGLLRSEVALSS